MKISSREVVNDSIVRRMLGVMGEKGISQQELIRYIGLGNGIFTHWKFDGCKTYMKYIDKIAECLGVSKDYLLHGIEDDMNGASITEQEIEIIELFRSLDKKKKALAIDMLKIICKWNEY